MPIPSFFGGRRSWAAGIGLLVVWFAAWRPVDAQVPAWKPRGASPNTVGQVEGITDREVVGAINAIAPHPTNANIVYVGAVNGGIWKSTNAMASSPHWVSLSDNQPTLSIGDLKFDPTDAKHQTLVAGTGRFSSFLRIGGARAGLLRSTNGGANWTVVDGGGVLKGLNVRGMAPRGATIVLAANDADSAANRGIWRSTNTGAAWTKISGGMGTGLPAGASFDLATDPSSHERLFTNAGGTGIYRSNDIGATWAKVSDPTIDALLAGSGNVKISVGSSNNVYVAIVRLNRLAGIFRSPDGGNTWTAMSLPTTAEGGIHPGGQGNIHMSMTADLLKPTIVYVGGDRQDTPFPNSIGAMDYSGRLFRGDASKPPASQWAHLTHSKTLGPAGGGTAHTSSPHADSRGMAMSPSGVLIECDDGGIYRRTAPQTNTGDWFSMNGDIQVTEFHSIAYDSNSMIIIGGAQDTGTPEQITTTLARFRSVSTGDGGMVAVDAKTKPGFSTRYSSFQFLGRFRRQVFDASNVLQSQVNPTLTVIGGGDPLSAQFYTPIKLNTVKPTRLIIGGQNSVYESMNQGDTIREIGPGLVVNGLEHNPIAYGAKDNPDMLYLGAGTQVFIRTAAHPSPLTPSAAYSGGIVFGITINPDKSKNAFVIDSGRVFRTTNAGSTWTNITGTLAKLKVGSLRSVAYVSNTSAGMVAVGTDVGVFAASGPSFMSWTPLGKGMPTVPVFQLDYSAPDKLLLAGTLGRGAWTLSLETTGIKVASVPPEGNEPVEPKEVGKVKPGPAPAKAPFVLRQGVIVDPVRRQAFLMMPQGGIEALDLVKGHRVWYSESAAKPLEIVGDRLLGQAEFSGEGSTVKIVALNIGTGEAVLSGRSVLPPGVKPTINETTEGQFLVRVRTSEAEPLISWQFFERPKRGVPPGTDDLPGAAAGVGSKKGTFRFTLATGKTAPVDGADIAIHRGPRAQDVPAGARLPGVEGDQFLSADGRHILASQTDDDAEWEKYTLSLYERASAKKLGEFKSHLPFVPFFVTGSLVVYETEAYSRRAGKVLVEEPLKIRALDLKSGKEAWSRVVRDTKYRGPYPP